MNTPPPDPNLESSRIRRLSGVATARPLPLQGDLADYHLSELLQFLLQTRRTGHLALERGDPPQAAAIHVAAGKLIDASCPPLRGDEAVIHLVGWRQGRFVFVAGATSAQCTVVNELPCLLLDGMRRSDELRRILATLPPADVVLHPVHDAELHDQRMTRLDWIVLSHIDGTHRIEDLLELFGRGQIAVARSIASLLHAGLVTIIPETGFLDIVTVRRTGSRTIHDEVANHICDLADGRLSLRQLIEASGLTPARMVQLVAELIQAGDLMIVAGIEHWLHHGDPLSICLDQG